MLDAVFTLNEFLIHYNIPVFYANFFNFQKIIYHHVAIVCKIFTGMIVAECFEALAGEKVAFKTKFHAANTNTAVVDFTGVMKRVGTASFTNTIFIKPGACSTKNAAGRC